MPEEPLIQRQISDEELQAISDLHLAAEEGDLAKVKQCLQKASYCDCGAGTASYCVLHKALRACDK